MRNYMKGKIFYHIKLNLNQKLKKNKKIIHYYNFQRYQEE